MYIQISIYVYIYIYVIEGEFMPRVVSFSGHEFAGSLLFEPEEGGVRPRVRRYVYI